MARAAGDADAKTVLTGDVASCYHRLGEYEAALALYDRVLAEARRDGDPLGEIGALFDRGDVYARMGRDEEAIADLRLALDLSYDEDYLTTMRPRD